MSPGRQPNSRQSRGAVSSDASRASEAADERSGKSSRRSGNPLLAVLLAGSVLLVVLAAHWPVLSAQALAFDDGEFLTKNRLVQNPSWASVRRFAAEVLEPSTVHGYYIPLTMISLMLDHAAGGRADDLRQFHRTNLFLHVLSVLAVVVLLYQLFGNIWAAALLGLLFGVHPLTVEPVAWIAERKTVLATCFALWCLVTYVSYARGGRRAWFVVSLGLSLLALLSKPTTVPLPVLLLVLDSWPLRRLSKRSVIEKIPFFVLACSSAVVTLVSNAQTANISLPALSADTSIVSRVSHNLLFYACKIVWPGDLTPYYAVPEPFDMSNPRVLTGLVAALCAAALLIVSLRWTRSIACGVLFFLVALLPTLGVVGFSWINVSDKYLYFPSVGLLLPLAYWLKTAWEPGSSRGIRAPARVGSKILLVALVVAAIVGTRNYLAKWSTSETLYTHMIALTPRAAVVHYSLASTLLDQGRTEEAVVRFRSAADLDPGMPDVHVGLGSALVRLGRPAEAEARFIQAININPDSSNAHNGLGTALAAQGRSEEAVVHFERAILSSPDHLEAHINLGALRLKQRRFGEAETLFRAAISIDPRSPGAHVNLGVSLKSRGNYDEAIRHYKKALESDPTHPEIYNNIARALKEQGKTEEAQAYFANGLFYKGLILERAGDGAGAAAHYREALRIRPSHKQSVARLGALSSSGQGQ